MSFVQTPNGLIIPKKKEKPRVAKCGFCANEIISTNEPKGRVYYHKNKPICATCRVFRGKKGKQIIQDIEKKRKSDFDNLEKHKIEKENKRIDKIASESIKDTNTSIKDNYKK